MRTKAPPGCGGGRAPGAGAWWKAAQLKAAVALRAALIDTVQVRAVPVHEPLQPVKVVPVAGVAVRVTEVPLLKLAEQAVLVVPVAAVAHDRPAGAELTVPEVAARALVTVRESAKRRVKVAVTVRAALIATVQVVAVPVQAPLQPLNSLPAARIAVRVTEAVVA